MTTSTPDLICPVCGTANPAVRQFCRKCAADLRAPVGDPHGAAGPAPAPVSLRPIVLGVAAAIVVLVALMGLLFALGGSPSPSPTPPQTPSAQVSDAPTLAPTLTPTSLPTEAPTVVPPPTPTTIPATAAAGDPFVDTLSGPGRASCTGTNGTGTPGYIHLKWTASNTTGVRLSIDPPAPNDAYDFGYDDYPADGEADVPFTCDPPNSDANGEFHLYVVTTLHDNGRFAWRFLRVYLRD
ncbi:MAG TPA: hypothetical protein VMQ65_11830 [Candidatus Limnocylindria bacterium]|nr:hypothetical protein [Candidatus Limnocylindria bacterium]